MPYIDKSARARLDLALGRAMNALAGCSDGELNYFITQILLARMDDQPKSYYRYSAAIGVLECVKLELYRRAVAPYEDKKREENGDVY